MNKDIVIDENVEIDKKLHWAKALVLCVLIPLAVGFISYLMTKDAMNLFDTIKKPPLSPPAWLFSVAWTILYILMGIGSFAIYMSKKEGKTMLLIVYGIQLFFNFLWTPVFFLGKAYWFAFAWLIIMLLMVLYLVTKSASVSKVAMICFIPYAAWCMFASYLNLAIAIMN